MGKGRIRTNQHKNKKEKVELDIPRVEDPIARITSEWNLQGLSGRLANSWKRSTIKEARKEARIIEWSEETTNSNSLVRICRRSILHLVFRILYIKNISRKIISRNEIKVS